MATIRADARFSRLYRVVILIGVFLYLVQGIKTEFLLVERKPILQTMLEDFAFYERALTDASTGGDPYSVLSIGPGYFYPPPALLLVEAFHWIVPFSAKIAAYTILNIAIIILIVSEVARRYRYSIKQIWYWYILCLGFAPFLELLHLGQINAITLLGIFLLFWASDSSSVLSGFGWCLGILTKVSPVIFVVYLIATKKIRTIVSACIWMAGLAAVTALRYGITPFLLYPKTLQWLTEQFPVGPNSQSLISKLIMVFGFNVPLSAMQVLQKGLTLYILLAVIASSMLTVKGKLPKEPLFILTAFGIAVLPNIMWYHHYVFLLLPILIWMAWMRLDPQVVIWCIFGLLLIQMDRFSLTDGLLAHGFVHVSIIAILVWQAGQVFLKKEVVAYLLPDDSRA